MATNSILWALSSVVAASLFIACASDEKSNTPAGAAGQSSSTASGGGGNVGGATNQSTSGQCVSVPDAVFPAQQFGDDDLVRQIHVDDATLYFRTYDNIFKVSTSGGTPETLDLGGKQPSQFWLQKDALLVRAGSSLFTVPKAAGTPAAAQELEPPPIDPLLGHPQTSLDDTHLYWLGKNGTSYGAYRKALDGGQKETLYETPDKLYGLTKSGTKLYFVQGDSTAGSIQSLALEGGTPTKVRDISGDALVGSDANSLFVTGSLGNTDFTKRGLYRLPLPGGEPALLRAGFYVDMSMHAVTNSDGTFVETVDNYTDGKVPTASAPSLLSIPAGASEAKLVWCIDDSYTTHALAVSAGTAYVSVYKRADNKGTIAKVQLK